MRKKIISMMLCLVMVLGIIPFEGIANAESMTPPDNYGKYIGNTARFGVEWSVSFLFFAEPQNFDYDEYEGDWANEDNWLYDYEDEPSDIPEDHLMVITDYYWDPVSTALWYEVEAAPGYALPERMGESSWVFQDFTDPELAYGDLIVIDENAVGFVLDAEGNIITEAEMYPMDVLELKSASTLQGNVAYQWQIFINETWVDIEGQDKAVLAVSAGMLANALDENYSANVRCIMASGSKTVTGDPFVITINLDGPEAKEMMFAHKSYSASPAAADQDGYCYVTVRYLFSNGAEAANPFVGQVLENGEIKKTIVFPKVQGYLPYYNEVQQDSLTIDIDEVTENITYTVEYKPTMVDYTVDVYFQNIMDDDYTYQTSKTLQGLTGSKVPAVTESYEGMYELVHETPTIAANGSTRLEIYYNRVYFLTEFELDGGFGVYSTYSRYGSELAKKTGTPTKPGYIFVGWDELSEHGGTGDGIADVLPDTVPAENRYYKAIWKQNPTADVRIAFWGQNPNDDGYSYIESETLAVKPGTVLNYGTGGNICGLEEHTHGAGCTYDCGKTEHTHDASCYRLDCDREHKHEDACYTCGQTGHSHGISCYPNVGDKANPSYPPNNPVEGQIYSRWIVITTVRYIYIEGSWYEYEANASDGTIISPTCGKEESTHTHNSNCLGCGKKEHSHTDYTGTCYVLTCTKEEHMHDAACTTCVQHKHSSSCKINSFDGYDASLWTLNTKKTTPVTVNADGSTVLNVYFDRTTFELIFRENGSRNGKIFGTIEAKWGALIIDQFNEISEAAGTSSWCTDYQANGSRTNYIRIMPSANRTYYSYYETGTERVATYYGQKLDGSGYEVLMEVKINRKSNTTVSKEEFAEFEGYTFNANASSKIDDSFGGSKFYYDRKILTLEFYNGIELARTESMKYGESFGKFTEYEPDLPDEYESGSRRFTGWYLNPECTGTPVDLSKLVMPAENMALYAGWELVYHNVNIYKEKNDDGSFGDEVFPGGIDPVLHGNLVFGDPDYEVPIPENSPYTFVGWFYMDDNVERMWDFANSVVSKDVDIYAKWSSEVLVPYEVRFIIENEDGSITEIADKVSGSSLAGTTVTIDAKTGYDLYTDYQTGYFPLTASNSLTMDVNKAESGMSYDFKYVAKAKVPYTVKYVDKNGNNLLEPKVVSNNTYAIVTEKFVYIENHSPDQYQKSLVVSGAEGAVNEIVFVYEEDDTQSVYNVTHYIQPVNGSNDYDDYIVYSNYGDIGIIGRDIEVETLDMKGFTFSEATINDEEAAVHNGKITAELVKEGLDIKLYYERNKYSYTAQYLDNNTGDVLKSADVYSPGGYYGAVVTALNIPEIDHYDYVSSTSCVISTEEEKNIIKVYYEEESVNINYEIVGPEGCGIVDPEYSRVQVATTDWANSTAIANDGYKFVGWYEDKLCTKNVTSGETIHLSRPEGGWTEKTYYAKFEPDLGPLVIQRTTSPDPTQVYVYEIRNKENGDVITVSIKGIGHVIINDMPFAEYEITQLGGWSWRHGEQKRTEVDHSPEKLSSKMIENKEIRGTFVEFSELETSTLWLNGNSSLYKNKWGGQ